MTSIPLLDAMPPSCPPVQDDTDQCYRGALVSVVVYIIAQIAVAIVLCCYRMGKSDLCNASPSCVYCRCLSDQVLFFFTVSKAKKGDPEGAVVSVSKNFVKHSKAVQENGELKSEILNQKEKETKLNATITELNATITELKKEIREKDEQLKKQKAKIINMKVKDADATGRFVETPVHSDAAPVPYNSVTNISHIRNLAPTPASCPPMPEKKPSEDCEYILAANTFQANVNNFWESNYPSGSGGLSRWQQTAPVVPFKAAVERPSGLSNGHLSHGQQQQKQSSPFNKDTFSSLTKVGGGARSISMKERTTGDKEATSRPLYDLPRNGKNKY